MNTTSNPHVKAELDNLKTQFGNRAYLTLDDYAALYEIDRRYASRHLRRRNIPFTKEGKNLYVSMLDLAIYKAKNMIVAGKPLIHQYEHGIDEMKRRRGFNQMAERTVLNCKNVRK